MPYGAHGPQWQEFGATSGDFGTIGKAFWPPYASVAKAREVEMEFKPIVELLSSISVIVGVPLAIFIFAYEQRKARANEEEEIHQMLADGYTDFLKLTLEHPDLKLQSTHATPDLNEEQTERMITLFAILVALFERAYMVAYEEKMPPRKARHWSSWEDFMREWCRREDFRNALPQLLPGEDPQFAVYITRLAAEEAARA
jgi:hypothetical protein